MRECLVAQSLHVYLTRFRSGKILISVSLLKSMRECLVAQSLHVYLTRFRSEKFPKKHDITVQAISHKDSLRGERERPTEQKSLMPFFVARNHYGQIRLFRAFLHLSSYSHRGIGL